MRSYAPGPRVVLYSRAGCHLCEAAHAELDRLRRRLPHELSVVDIGGEPELEQRYGEHIPVVLVGGREYAAPLPPAALERALRAAIEARVV